MSFASALGIGRQAETSLAPLEIVGEGGTCGLKASCEASNSTLSHLPGRLSAPGGSLRLGDRVAVTAGDSAVGTVHGEVVKLHPMKSSQPLAIVMLDHEAGFAPTANLKLTQVNAKLWLNEAGDVYLAGKPMPVGANVAESDLQFVPDLRAVEASKAAFIDGAGPIGPESYGVIKMNGDLIEASAGNRQTLLAAMDSAPELQFKDSPLLNWRSHPILNPSGKTTNCVACTAAAVKTLESGVLTTADDIANMTLSNGSRLGEPYVGRFDTKYDAFKYLTDATGAEIGDTVPDANKMVPGKSYALLIDVDPRANGDRLHMAFAHRFEDGRSLFYDAQSGVRWGPQSFTRAHSIVSFHELKFGGAK